MAYYTALTTAWNAQGVPAGASGTAITGAMTTAQKLVAANSWTVPGVTSPTIIATYKIYNAIVPADFQALTAPNQQLVRDIFGMGTVDASPGTNVRATLASVFAGKTTTINALLALDAAFTSTIPWWQSNGYSSSFTLNDAMAAGLS